MNFLFITERETTIAGEVCPTLSGVDLESFETEMPVTVKQLKAEYAHPFDLRLEQFETFSTLSFPLFGSDEDFVKCFEQVKKNGMMFSHIFLDVRNPQYAWAATESYRKCVNRNERVFNAFIKHPVFHNWVPTAG